MKSVYYNEFKNVNLSSDLNRYKPVKKEAINSSKNALNTKLLHKLDSSAVSEITEADKNENSSNLPDFKINSENKDEKREQK